MSAQDAAVKSGRRVYAYGEPGKTYAVYAAAGGAFSLALPAGEYAATRYDPRTGEKISLGPVRGGAVRPFELPSGDDWVLLLRSTAQGSSNARPAGADGGQRA